MKEVSEKHMKKIYLNILKAILVVIYFLTLNLVSEKISALYLERGIEICTMIFLFLAIFIFELAYKKDDDDLVVQGIEVLVLSAYTLTSQYITKRFNFNFKIYFLASSYIIAIYFIVKCIWYYTKGRKEIADDLSDIKEIVKEKEPVKIEDIKLKNDVTTTKKTEAKSKTTKTPATKKKATTKVEKDVIEKTEAKSKTPKTPVTKKKTTTKVEKDVTENKEAKSKTPKTPATKKKTTTKVEKDVTKNKETKSKTPKTPATKKKATTKVEKQGIENKKKKTTKKKVDEEK